MGNSVFPEDGPAGSIAFEEVDPAIGAFEGAGGFSVEERNKFRINSIGPQSMAV
jgi:hypothetical protein